MKIEEFIEKFTIDPTKDIEPNFKLVKELEIDAGSHKGCLNCDDKANQTHLKSSSWTGVQYCWVCNSLNVIYYQDRMSGVSCDGVYCYQENKEVKND